VRLCWGASATIPPADFPSNFFAVGTSSRFRGSQGISRTCEAIKKSFRLYCRFPLAEYAHSKCVPQSKPLSPHEEELLQKSQRRKKVMKPQTHIRVLRSTKMTLALGDSPQADSSRAADAGWRRRIMLTPPCIPKSSRLSADRNPQVPGRERRPSGPATDPSLALVSGPTTGPWDPLRHSPLVAEVIDCHAARSLIYVPADGQCTCSASKTSWTRRPG